LKASIDHAEIPDANEEYLLYQTLIGAWPFKSMNADERAVLTERIENYMIKAIREAKVHTSWISPNEDHERGVRDFIRSVLRAAPENRFLKDFVRFQAIVARAGMYNSLSQTLLKITLPGVPDFYQGSELWNFSLVDPDNRRSVDFARRRELLDSLKDAGDDPTALLSKLLKKPEDGRIKLYVTNRALRFRSRQAEIFAEGDYLPLEVTGERQNNVIAFARKPGDRAVIVLTARFFTRLGTSSQLPVGDVWKNTAVVMKGEIKAGRYRDIFTGKEMDISAGEDGGQILLREAFAHLPLALLEPVM